MLRRHKTKFNFISPSFGQTKDLFGCFWGYFDLIMKIVKKIWYFHIELKDQTEVWHSYIKGEG